MSRKKTSEKRPGDRYRARRDGTAEAPDGPAALSQRPRRFSDDLEGPRGIIPHGLRVEGNISGEGHLEVQGEVIGEISTDGLVLIGADGRLQGDLSAAGAVVEGRMVGKIAAQGKVELRASSHVQADIQAQGVALAEGSFFEGKIHMLGGSDRLPVTFKEKRRS